MKHKKEGCKCMEKNSSSQMGRYCSRLLGIRFPCRDSENSSDYSTTYILSWPGEWQNLKARDGIVMWPEKEKLEVVKCWRVSDVPVPGRLHQERVVTGHRIGKGWLSHARAPQRKQSVAPEKKQPLMIVSHKSGGTEGCQEDCHRPVEKYLDSR